MNIRTLLEDFQKERRATDKARELITAIESEQLTSPIVDEYVFLYNRTSPSDDDWHFWWVFSIFPIQTQIELIEKALATPTDSRNTFDKRLLSEKRVLELLNIPENSQHKTLFKMIGYGWDYYIRSCDPLQKNKEGDLSVLIKFISSLKH